MLRGNGWHAPFGASPPSFFAHDLVRKPDTTFRDHAFAGGESFRGVVVKQNSGAKARRENDFCCLQKDIQGGFIVGIWKAFRPQRATRTRRLV
jgi:hypothetical protein